MKTGVGGDAAAGGLQGQQRGPYEDADGAAESTAKPAERPRSADGDDAPKRKRRRRQSRSDRPKEGGEEAAAAKPATSYAVVASCTDTDADCIRQLWQRNLPGVPAARYDWLYRSGMARGWLLKTSTGNVVGSTGLMQRRLQFFGRARRAGQAVDLNVDREHRFATPALKLQRAVTATARSGESDLIYGFTNSQSTALLRRAGYRPLGELQRWVKPLRLGPKLRSRGQRGPARNAAARLAMPLVRLASPETYRYRRRSRRVQVIDGFDGRFDDLWATASPRFLAAALVSSIPCWSLTNITAAAPCSYALATLRVK